MNITKLLAGHVPLNKVLLIREMIMKLYFIVLKAALFMLCAVMFLPMSVFIGSMEYEEGVHNAMSRFIKEIYDGGYITKEMKEELDNDLAGL